MLSLARPVENKLVSLLLLQMASQNHRVAYRPPEVPSSLNYSVILSTLYFCLDEYSLL